MFNPNCVRQVQDWCQQNVSKIVKTATSQSIFCSAFVVLWLWGISLFYHTIPTQCTRKKGVIYLQAAESKRSLDSVPTAQDLLFLALDYVNIILHYFSLFLRKTLQTMTLQSSKLFCLHVLQESEALLLLLSITVINIHAQFFLQQSNDFCYVSILQMPILAE